MGTYTVSHTRHCSEKQGEQQRVPVHNMCRRLDMIDDTAPEWHRWHVSPMIPLSLWVCVNGAQ